MIEFLALNLILVLSTTLPTMIIAAGYSVMGSLEYNVANKVVKSKGQIRDNSDPEDVDDMTTFFEKSDKNDSMM